MEKTGKERYAEHLKSDYWKLVAKTVKERDDHRCRICDSSIDLEVHHRCYYHVGSEMDHLDDLICLCAACHRRFHRWRPKWDWKTHTFTYSDDFFTAFPEPETRPKRPKKRRRRSVKEMLAEINDPLELRYLRS